MSRSLWVLDLHFCCDICQYQVLFSISRTQKWGENRPETGKLILEDTRFFPRFYKLAWCIFKNWHWHQRNYNMVSLAIYHLFPIPQLGEVEMWQVVGRSDGNLMDLLGKLKYQRSRNVIGKLGLEEWEKEAKRINLLKLSFLVHWSWNGLFYTLNWVRWCRQGLQLSKILSEVTGLGRKYFSLLNIPFSSVITVQP